MCFLMDNDEDGTYDNDLDTGSKRSGAKRWHFHTHHRWIIPRKVLMLVLAVALFMLLMGMFFMAIGGGIGSVVLKVLGGILFGLGFVGLVICFLVTVYAYFFYGTRNQSTQTTETQWSNDTVDAPGYASVGRPSALKSPDSTLKRNGTLGVKKVTLAPELGDYGVVQPNNSMNINNNVNNSNANTVIAANNQPIHRIPSSGSGVSVVHNPPLHRLPSTGSSVTNSRANSMPRTTFVDGSTVGTGGIKITSLDPNQPFPSPASSISTGQYYSTGGGGSTLSGGSATDTYAYPKSYDSGNSGSQSQYSTLRSIPVTHLGTGQNQSSSSYKEVEYATVNKSGSNKPGSSTIVRVEHVPVQHHSNMSSPTQGLMSHVQMGHKDNSAAVSPQTLIQNNDDGYRDYDNTFERSPMLSTSAHHQKQQQQQQQQSSNKSYHEKQMQFQRHRGTHHHQQQQDLHSPRQINSYSLQKQYAPNPFTLQQQHQQQQEQQMQQYKLQYEQEKKQQQHQFQTEYSKSSNASSARNSMVDDVFEPQPLVYPSARRPMTFEQVSSSKMSVYDNVLANTLKESDEVEG